MRAKSQFEVRNGEQALRERAQCPPARCALASAKQHGAMRTRTHLSLHNSTSSGRSACRAACLASTSAPAAGNSSAAPSAAASRANVAVWQSDEATELATLVRKGYQQRRRLSEHVRHAQTSRRRKPSSRSPSPSHSFSLSFRVWCVNKQPSNSHRTRITNITNNCFDTNNERGVALRLRRLGRRVCSRAAAPHHTAT